MAATPDSVTDLPTARVRLALIVAVSLGGLIAIVAAGNDWGVGLLIGFASVVGGILGMAYLDFRRERAALLERLGGREPIPVARQARDLLTARGLTVHEPALSTIVARWKEVGIMLAVNPAILRPEDDLRLDYRPARARLVEPGALDHFQWEVESRNLREGIPARMYEGAAGGAAACFHCRYDLRGLQDGTPCPECGHEQVVIRTLGDYLLFVARLVPARPAGGGG